MWYKETVEFRNENVSDESSIIEENHGCPIFFDTLLIYTQKTIEPFFCIKTTKESDKRYLLPFSLIHHQKIWTEHYHDNFMSTDEETSNYLHAHSKTIAAYDMSYDEIKDVSRDEWKTEGYEYLCFDGLIEKSKEKFFFCNWTHTRRFGKIHI